MGLEDQLMLKDYQALLERLRGDMAKTGVRPITDRLEFPTPNIIWIGNKTIFRNFMDFPKLLRRDPNRLLMFMAKELATAASLDGDRAIFIGRKNQQSFSVLLQRYVKDFVQCHVCRNPDTHLERVKRLQFLVCEACGARSSISSRAVG